VRLGPIRIVDSTLREGGQASGVQWTPESSVAIARALAALGVDAIECGHPAVGEAERARIRAVLEAALPPPVLCHARALESDIDFVAEVGAPWVGLFLGLNDLSRIARIRKDLPDLVRQIGRTVAYAKSRGLAVRFTLEDASRTGDDERAAAYDAAAAGGADRLGYADTAGVAEPAEVARGVDAIRRAHPALPVEVHLHDDRGLALASALAAVDAGATWISSSMNGLGERCGIVDTAAVLVNLAVRGQRLWPVGEALQAAADLVDSLSGSPRDARRPVTGAHAFTHVAKLHVRAMERDPRAYAWIPAERVGRRVRLRD
jgi:2-isopropylmalate synthase